MQYLKIIAAIFVVGVLVYALVFYKPSSPAPIPTTNLESQTNFEGAVSVTLLPRNLSEKNIWEFEVTLNTHSAELNEDLTQAAVLIGNDGQEFGPLSWEGDPPGGHHRVGILKFGPLSPAPQKIELVIRGIGGIQERKFLWMML